MRAEPPAASKGVRPSSSCHAVHSPWVDHTVALGPRLGVGSLELGLVVDHRHDADTAASVTSSCSALVVMKLSMACSSVTRPVGGAAVLRSNLA